MAVISRRNKNFKKLYAQLPTQVQETAVKGFLLWREDPWHPSLNFEDLGDSRWSVRIGAHHRALGFREGDKIAWYWIGTHEAYNKLL